MSTPEGRFSELRLRGGRYERPGYPVETLAELSRYERLIIDVAKGLWKSSNPSRARLPKGFTNLLQLRLTGFQSGSVVPLLVRDDSGSIYLMDGVGSLFERARDLVEDSIDALARGAALPGEMPADALTSFIRFGSSLREDEGIEFTSSIRESRIMYNQEIRRKLAARISVERFQEAGSTAGRVIELNAETRSFTFSTLRGTVLNGRYSDESLTSDFVAVLHSLTKAPVVRVDGTFTVTAAGETVEIEDVRSVELFELDSEPWTGRFVELLTLEKGWLDGVSEGEEVSFAALDFAREVLSRCISDSYPLPGIFPMPEGGIQLEWKIGGRLTSIEIDSDANAELYSLNANSGTDNSDRTVNPAAAFDFFVGAAS